MHDRKRPSEEPFRELGHRHRLPRQRVVRDIVRAADVVRRPRRRIASGEAPGVQRTGVVPLAIADAADPRLLSLRDQRLRDDARLGDAIERQLALELRGAFAQVIESAQSPIISFTYFAPGDPNESIVSCSFLSCPLPCFFSHAERMSFISMLPTK